MSTKTPFGRAVRWAYVMTIGQRGLALGLTFLLAALVGPRDFGTIAMAMAYILFVEMFVAQGMDAAIIQRKDLTPLQLDSIFGLVLGVSAVLVVVTVLLAGWWADVNNVPALKPVIWALSLSIPIRGLTVVQKALLERDMKFKELAFLRGGAVLIAGTVGVMLALAGAGIWSLVTQQLLAAGIASSLMWRASSWRPQARFSWRAVRSLFNFSGGVLASQLGAWVSAQADLIVMGLFFGPVAVGLYRLGERIMAAILEVSTRSIQVVALPHFSDVRDDPVRLRESVLKCVRISATVTIPLLIIAGALADDLFALLGPHWAPAASVLRIVIIMGMTKSVILFGGPLLYALGRTRLVAALIWTLGGATAIGMIATGSMLRDAPVQTQIIGIAAVRTGLLTLLFAPPMLLLMRRLAGTSFRALLAAITPAIASASAATIVSVSLDASNVVPAMPPLFALIARGVLIGGAAGFTLLAVDAASRNIVRAAADSSRARVRRAFSRVRPFGTKSMGGV